MSAEARGSVRTLVALCGLYFLILWLPSLTPYYGFYSDELYYLACTQRLAFGYVDQPPFFVWVLRLHAELFGDSLFALRALPAAAGAATAFLTGWMTRRMGGGTFAQCLALLAIAAGQSLVMFGFLSVNCLGILFWTLACWIVVELCLGRDRRLWLALGAVLGIAFLTKHTIVILLAGLTVGTLLSPLREDLRTRWPWLAAGVFALFALPNLVWQAAHDWPSWAFYQYRATTGNLRISPLAVVVQQIMTQNPATLPVWGAGALFLLRSPRGRRFRPLGWAFLGVFGLAMAGGQAVPYRIAGIFPVLFAGGGVLLEATRKPDAGRLRRVWNTWTLPGLILLVGVAIATLAMPLLPPPVLEKHPLWGGRDDWRVAVEPLPIPYHLANRTHWEQYADAFAQVLAGLEPEEREGVVLFADYFGHAGALEYYGRGLAPVYSSHTGYFLWGPPEPPPQTLVATGPEPELLQRYFRSVRVARRFQCSYCPGWLKGLPILVASGPTGPFAELWAELGRQGGMAYYHRRVDEHRASLEDDQPR